MFSWRDWNFCGLVVPEICHPYDAVYRVSFADQMSVTQTATWIWTLAYSKKWLEAEAYAIIFRENCIDGETLKFVNLKLLVEDLEITNIQHC